MKKILIGEGLALNLLGPLVGLFYCLLRSGISNPSPVIIVTLWTLIALLSYLKGENFTRGGAKLGLLSLFVTSLLSLFGTPPFENDFYRYFFEGQAFLAGFNPYLQSPASLFHEISFQGIFKIGHPDLTGIYPPMTLGLFAMISFISGGSLSLSLLIFSLFNGTLLWLLLTLLEKKRGFHIKKYFPLILVVVIRECLFQYHFELWAVLPFVWALTASKNSQIFLGFFMSFHLKFLGAIGVLYFFLKRSWKMTGLFSTLLLLSFVWFDYLGLLASPGLMAFSERWLFAPGLLNFFWPSLESLAPFGVLKVTSLGLGFVVGLCLILKERRHLERGATFYLVFLLWTFLYFSPVYNAWYALWPGLALVVIGGPYSRLGAYSLMTSSLCYLFYVNKNSGVLFVGNLVVHLPYLIILYSVFRGPDLNSNHNQETQPDTF